MSAGAYAWGCIVLGGTLGLLAAAASALTRVWFSDWDRALRLLAGTALVLAWVFAVSYLLGALGAFRPVPVFLGLNVGAAALLIALRDRGRDGAGGAAVPRRDREWWRDWPMLAAIAGTIISVGTWLPATAHAYRYGILEPDSTWYHGHTVGRFLQTGWLTRIQPVGTDAMVPFHPVNREVLDALLVMPWHRDLVLPLVSLAGLGLLLLAGWCVGSYWQRAPLGLLAMALIASPATIRVSQPGSLKNDLLAAAFMTSGIALVLHGRRRLPAVALSGVMLGLAVGTRTNLILPVAVIVATGLGMFVLGHIRDRRDPGELAPEEGTENEPTTGDGPRPAGPEPARWLVAITWVGALVVYGAYWYVRNWVRVGSPLPWSDISLGPLHLEQAGTGEQRYFEQTILHWRNHPQLVSSALRPGLRLAFGDLWWAWALLGTACALLAAWKLVANGRRSLWSAGLAVAGGLGVLAHAATPLSLVASPDSPVAPTNIAINTRYALPAFGLVVLAGVASVTRRWMELAFSLLLLALVVVAAVPTRLYDDASFDGEATDRPLVLVLGAVLGGLAAAAIVGLPHLQERPPLQRFAGLAVPLLLLGVLALPAANSYLDRRYATPVPVHGGELWVVTRDLSDTQIGMATTSVPYPYFGEDFSNEVAYVGVAGVDGLLRDARTCAEWVRELRERQFTYVALTPHPLATLPVSTAKSWTLALPGTEVVHDQGEATLIQLPPDLDPSACGDEVEGAEA